MGLTYLVGNKMEKARKVGICTQCSRKTNKIAVCSDAMGVLVCDVCDRANQAKIRKYRQAVALRKSSAESNRSKQSDQSRASNRNKEALIQEFEEAEEDLEPDEIVEDDEELDKVL